MISTDPAVWVQTFIILGMLTVIWRDNIIFRIASFTVVGLATADALCLSMYTVNTKSVQLILSGDYMQILVLIFSLLSLARLIRAYGWISRFPTAFILGLGLSLSAGPMTRVILEQIAAQVELLTGASGPIELVSGVISLVACISTLIYFVFTSKLRRFPAMSAMARIGRYFFMIGIGGLCGVYVVGNFQYQGQALKMLIWEWLGFGPG